MMKISTAPLSPDVDFGRVAYLFYFYQIPNGFRAPVGDFKEIRQSLNLVQHFNNQNLFFNDQKMGF